MGTGKFDLVRNCRRTHCIDLNCMYLCCYWHLPPQLRDHPSSSPLPDAKGKFSNLRGHPTIILWLVNIVVGPEDPLTLKLLGGSIRRGEFDNYGSPACGGRKDNGACPMYRAVRSASRGNKKQKVWWVHDGNKAEATWLIMATWPQWWRMKNTR